MTNRTWADVGPPVKIAMPADAPMAAAGQAYKGTWEVRVGRPGVIDDFTLEGQRWTVQDLDRSLEGTHVKAGVHRIPFTATPSDPNAPLRFTLRYEGRPASRRLRLGPVAFASRGADRPAVQTVPGGADGQGRPAGGAITLRFTGRIVYTRPGDIDSDFNPIWFGATDEGVDRILVEVMDEDDITDETIWSGYTNPDGTFDSGEIQWDDCDPGCDDPDVYLRWESDTDIVNVQDADDILEPDYSWSTADVQVYDDFTGSQINFGSWKPADQDQMGALHIHNNITRTHRFIQNKSGLNLDTPEVDVLWPDGTEVATAFYDGEDVEIHITPRRTWRDSTHSHEYGHHFLNSFAENVEPEYCNGFCDGTASCTSGTKCENVSHCRWCPETDHDAWNEGFPNWLADIVTRDMPAIYTASDGSPYEPLNYRDLENLGVCCQDGSDNHPPFRTEGYIGALLRDIEDGVDLDGNSLQDDHNGDGHSDCLALGYDEIFTIAAVHDVTTPLQFINTFLAEYPQHTYRFYSTAFNVHPDYTTPFPIDNNPPGKVQAVTSPSHPIGVGGTLPCITVQWDVPPDDVTGACGYSFNWGTHPLGDEPDSDEFGNYIEGSCVTLTRRPFSIGDYYISIRAKDCYNHWSNEWDVFGPFTVTECNGNGIVDICETYCDPSAFPTTPCDVNAGFCTSLPICGFASDCNGNFAPDECDIADGTSQDCNNDGIPDECQPTLKNYTGLADTPPQSPPADAADWGDPRNWRDLDPPVDGDMACIRSGVPTLAVNFSEDSLRLESLSCEIDFGIHRLESWFPDLEIEEPSFIDGDLTISGASTLKVDDTLDVGGALNWNGGIIHGPGDLNVSGGFDLNPPGSRTELRSAAHVSILGGAVDNHNDKYVELHDTSVFTIGLPVTYTYNGNFNIFAGSASNTVEVDGTLIRASGDGRATVSAFVDNAGLIHNQAGELSLGSGGTHTGFVLCDPGTLLSLVNGTYEWTPGSSLTADDVTLSAGNPSTIRGNVNIAGTLTVGNPSASTLTFTNEANVTSYGESLFARAGTVRFESPAAPAVDFDSATVGEGFIYCGNPYFDTGETVVMNTLHLVCGTINGADPITINDAFTWGGGGSFFNGGAVTCLGPVTIQATSSQRDLTRVFNNTAHATFLGQFSPSGAGRFNNLTTGTVDLQGDNTGLNGGQSTNAGTITKTAGTGRSTLAGMTNSGLIHAQTGEIAFSGTGANNGDILGDPGTLLTFINGTYEMHIGSSLTGDDVTVLGSTCTIRGDVNITGTLSLGNSSSGGNATFTDEANVASYGHTVLARSGSVRFEAPVVGPSVDFNTVTIGEGNTNGQTYFDTGQPVNINTLNLMRGNIQGADPITIHDAFTWGPVGTIFSGGTITCRAPWTLQASSSSRSIARDFINHGYASLFGPVNLSNADFTNEPGGTVDFKTDAGGFGLTLTSHVQNNGAIIKTGGSGDSPISTHFTNAGTLEIQTGRVNFQANYTLNFIQTGGATVLNGGDLSTTGNPYNIQGGDLAGIGTVFGEVNNSGGRVTPGLSVGTLTCDGDYTHGENATLKVELGGLNPGTEHDQLVVTGIADIQGGTLEVVPANGFLVQVGQQFVILTTADVQGTFDDVTGPGQYTGTYNATNVTLTVDAPPCTTLAAPDFDQDCDVDIDDFALFEACAAGPTVPYAPGCDDKDLDADGDADLSDFGLLQQCFSGPGVPADPTCAD